MYSDYVKIHFCLNAFLNFLEKMFALPGLRRFQVASLNQFNHAAAFIYYFKRIFAFVFVIKTFCLTFTMFFCFVYTRIHFYLIFCFGFILIFFCFCFNFLCCFIFSLLVLLSFDLKFACCCFILLFTIMLFCYFGIINKIQF